VSCPIPPPSTPRLHLRRLLPTDSLAALTTLLHRAYGPLAEAGLRFHASYQGEDVTLRRISEGECMLAVRDGQVVGTLTLKDADQTGGSPWYDRPEVASFGQFAVEPRLQGLGIGTALMDWAEERAREKGVREIALDTAEGAARLIRWYSSRGYRFIEHVQWPRDTVNYRSVILSKTLAPPSARMPAP